MASVSNGHVSAGSRPWWEWAHRWGQTNLVEVDVDRFDIEWWRAQWAHTRTQGIIVNCGGIAAYYPTKLPSHKAVPGVENRDLFGEILAAARSDGLAVVARLDSNRADGDVLAEHPEWFCHDREGAPYRRGDKYATCINSGYYNEFIPSVLREVSEGYRPDAFADNGWAGLDRRNICYCEHCERRFFEWSRRELPKGVNWNDDVYRQWIEWGYARRTELWRHNNRVTRAAGGDTCVWIGMLHGQLAHNSAVFQDIAALVTHTPVVMVDFQRRKAEGGFEQNAEVAKRFHSIAGWDKPVIESMAMYDMGAPAFRLSSMPHAEAELWMTEGWAGGMVPWWHHIGAVHDDKRQYETAAGLLSWHAANDEVLQDRVPAANVGVVWSQRNLDFYGRDDAANTAESPYAGVTKVLVAESIPFVPVHIDAIANTDVDVLVLPDIAIMSDAQCDHVRRFVERGGSLVVTGTTSARDENGRVRHDFGLADLMGAHYTHRARGAVSRPPESIEIWDRHSYLRIVESHGERHPTVAGLEGTGTISFGGHLPEIVVDPDRDVPLTFVPEFPIFPPETSWMRTPETDIPALVATEIDSGPRIVYIPADLDRCAFREEQPDHVRVIANSLAWALNGRGRIKVECQAPVNSNVYRRHDGFVVHINNLITTTSTPGRQADVVPYGPVGVRLRVDDGARIRRVVGLVDSGDLPFEIHDQWVTFVVPTIAAHEVIHIESENHHG
ncbi:alpha-amylase family protein [Microbacterium sp. MPKO10]|uniref:alpha-amylase family protein n=1 Tax=Microbacterium sp. MPKO10 TaxID=2989818 RepID=UPI0022367CAA|nr:alpha-amylase family protein [Microbacterium sp. MPKO10]MCW4459819.1 beta-galactosidase trimerization domain-containing protein [Microbacterium sp. MPKO10]